MAFDLVKNETFSTWCHVYLQKSLTYNREILKTYLLACEGITLFYSTLPQIVNALVL